MEGTRILPEKCEIQQEEYGLKRVHLVQTLQVAKKKNIKKEEKKQVLAFFSAKHRVFCTQVKFISLL